MNKKILVVGAGTSQVNSIKHAVSLGFEIFAIDGDINAPGFSCAKEFRSGDIKNSRNLIKAAMDYGVNGVTSFSTDVPIVAIAETVSHLNLPGISIDQAKLSVNKYLQRKLLLDSEIPAPRFEAFHSIEDGLSCLSNFSDKCVIKPIDASGSRGVRFSSNDPQTNSKYCAEALKYSLSGIGIIEDFVAGQEIAIDGFVINGVTSVLCISDKKRTDPPYLLDMELLFPSKISSSVSKEVNSLATQIIQASKIQNSPFHMEMILSKDGPILVEFGARGAGFNVYDIIIPFVTGIDTIEAQLNQCIGNKISLGEIHTKSAYLYFLSSSKKGVLRRVKGEKEILSLEGISRFKMFKKEGESVNKLTSGSDRIGYILALTGSKEESFEAINKAKNLLELTII